MITDFEVTGVTSRVYAAAWGQITPEEAARQILDALNPTIWPRRSPGYGTTGTRRTRKATK